MNEEGNKIVCRAVLDLPESQGQTLDTPRQDAVVTHSHVEMGTYYFGFYHEVSQDDTMGGFYLIDC